MLLFFLTAIEQIRKRLLPGSSETDCSKQWLLFDIEGMYGIVMSLYLSWSQSRLIIS